MALAQKISTFRIVANSTTHDIPVQNMELTTVLEEFTDPVQAVDGTRYIYPAGSRRRISIDYDGNIDGSEWRSLYNDIYTHLITNSNQFFDFYLDSTNTSASDLIEVQPEDLDSFIYRVNYANQLKQFLPSITLIERERSSTIGTEFEG